ncbi:isopeptide-forming domain-containing fimbrial protein [Lactiplantibacillus plantarum]|uniref:isopeptide-forming domain-containing fimbrial protein n=1 Tax=Lactiplantibacillus plantarum TaxID=1590 RepID=UPI001BA8927D|nr:isopeptide-forming domain-containing fimbrial protein [Lactiplantibacillus plantarum]MBS0935722.1 isopeptide-forming domain-containing fimbrial protein [Lactiplantibacillus plantarum]MBS0943921.1 isopeptide-forming domain-containing fimbrial protein [Lactiplantibacillus plantarum]
MVKADLTKKVKATSKRVVALSAIVLTLTPMAIGRTGQVTARADDTTSGGKTSKEIAVTPDKSALNAAIEKAKSAGVDVTEQPSKSQVVNSSDLGGAQQNIAKDYADQAKKIDEATAAQTKQTDAYNKAVADYKAQLASWQTYMQHPTYTNSTQWPNKTIDDFIGSDPASVTYVSNSTKKMTLDYGNVQKVTPTQYEYIKAHYKGGLTLQGIDSNSGTWVVLQKGSTFTYKEPFVDSTTGNPVDVKFTVKTVDDKQIPAYAFLTKDEMGNNFLTPNLTGSYDVKFFDHKTGEPDTLQKALIGFGDIDATQAIKFDQDAAKTLVGDKVVQVNANEFKAKDETAYPDSETGTQVWRRMDKVSGFSYTWSQGKNFWTTPSMSDDFHALGDISFAMNLKTRPQDSTPPTPDKQKVSYQLTDLLVMPSNHKDVELGDNPDKDTASVDGKTVAKGDILTYPLINTALPANREKDITSYVMTDPVQKELTINQDEIQKANNQNWNVKVDGRTVTYSANEALLKAMNADKTKDFTVPTAKLIGTVNSDNVTIKNQVNTKINDQVTVDSNVPENKVEKVSPSLIAKRIEAADGKLVTTDDNINILTGKDVYFDIFNQYDNNSHTDDLTDNDTLPKDAKVDTSKVKVMMSDGKADIFSMTADKLTSLAYNKDVTADTDITFKDGKLTVKPKAGKEDEFKSQQTKVRFAASLTAQKADTQLQKTNGEYLWNNAAEKGTETSNKVTYKAEKAPDLIAKKVEDKDGKLVDDNDNTNIINNKTVPFDVFSQFNNLGDGQYMTANDQLPKDAQVDLKQVKVSLSDGKADAKSMTADKLATLTYNKDVTNDFTVTYEQGKLIVLPKADKAAQYAGKQVKTHFVASLATDKINSELTKKDDTFTWTNQATNGKDKSKQVNYHAKEVKPETEPKKETQATQPAPTKEVKMAQTGQKSNWLTTLFSWFE